MEPRARRTALDDSPIDPVLTFIDRSDAVVQVEFDDFAGAGAQRHRARGVPVRRVADRRTARYWSTTVFDLLMAQFGVGRGLDGRLPDELRRRERAVHAGVAGAASPASAATRCSGLRASWPRNAEKTERQVHGHHRRRRQPLVPQQPDLPLGHHRADAVRLLSDVNGGGHEPLRRPGEACRPGALVDARLRPRLGQAAAACSSRRPGITCH